MSEMVSADAGNNQGKIVAGRSVNRDFLANLIAAQIDQGEGTSYDAANVAIEVMEGLGFLRIDLIATGQSGPVSAA